MSILDTFLDTHINDQEEFSKRELLLFAFSVLREAERIEHDNVGSPGKAAIEYLLNTKYSIIENRTLAIHTKDKLLAEIDAIINKLVIKYHVKKKGKNFYFDESLAIVEPAVIGPAGSDLLADLYAANTELEVLRIQLARTSLQSSDCFRLKAAIIDKENQIKEIKLAITKQKYFSHTDDQNSFNSIYRRSIGEEVSNGAGAGLMAGGLAGTLIGRHHGMKTSNYNFHKKNYDKAKAKIDKLTKETINHLNDYDKARYFAAAASKDEVKRAGFSSRQAATKAAIDSKKASIKSNKLRNYGKKVIGKISDSLGKAGTKVAKSTLKGLGIGAVAGLGAGAGAYKLLNKNK